MGDQSLTSEKLIRLLNTSISPCQVTDPHFCEKLSELIGDARLVLMGEATHGTREFYQARIALSQYLIQNKGFQAIAIEGDWTSVYPLHRFCQGAAEIAEIHKAFSGIKRFPRWMWRNTTIVGFLEWLKIRNSMAKIPAEKVAFYGLDLYCLHDAAQAVIDYLKIYHPEAMNEAIRRYACFDHVGGKLEHYGYLVKTKFKESCVKEVTAQLLEMQRLVYQNIGASLEDKERQFYALQNARVVKNAENYYQSLFEPHHVTWNIRDQHMADTLQNIIAHLESIHNVPAKVIVWAHNSHVGDARATEMSYHNEINLGQLVRERFGKETFLLGFSTATGTVTAASKWNGEAHIKKVQLPLPGSYEWLFHQAKDEDFILNLRDDKPLITLLKSSQLQRAIGVIYLPESERDSHYYFSHLPNQFDAIVHLDKTHAIVPLDLESKQASDLPDTYPEGL